MVEKFHFKLGLRGKVTEQSIFNHSYKFLKEQGVPAKNMDNNVCMYEDYNTRNRCAVGCLLTKEELNKKIEVSSWYVPDSLLESKYRSTGNKVKIAMKDFVGGVDELGRLGVLPERFMPFVDLLCEIQSIHDECEDFTNIDEDYAELAEKHNLKFKKIGEN